MLLGLARAACLGKKIKMERTIQIRMQELCNEIAAEADHLGYPDLAVKIRNWTLKPLSPEPSVPIVVDCRSMATNIFVEDICCQSGCGCNGTAKV